MPTSDFYTYQRDVRTPAGGSVVAYAATSGLQLYQGEMVAYSSNIRQVVRFVRDGTQGKFAGISRDSQATMRKLGNQSALDQFTAIDFTVFSTGVHLLKGKAGETYSHGDPVYMDSTNTDVVTKTASGGVQIGVAWLPDGSQKVGAVRVPILIDNFTITQV